MSRISDETDLDYELLLAINDLDTNSAVGVLAGSIFQKLVEKFWDFDQNDFNTGIGSLFAFGFIRFASNETRGLVLTEKGQERIAQGSV